MARRYYYEIELTHEGLNKYRIVKAETRYELQQKANAITAQWNNQWNRIIEREKRKKMTKILNCMQRNWQTKLCPFMIHWIKYY